MLSQGRGSGGHRNGPPEASHFEVTSQRKNTRLAMKKSKSQKSVGSFTTYFSGQQSIRPRFCARETALMRRNPMEILAPVGNHEMLKAAIENGADAVYFGVQAFNARMRANNFLESELPDIMRQLHERGMKGYLTLNVLVFEDEINEAANLLLSASRAGVDAIIIQDLGLASFARKLVPDLPLHASTQMTITSSESISALQMLGIDFERVVVARELNTEEIERITQESEVELEVFIHGALCVAYSGQCLTSEALGGRSANRGECAQACRLPYDLIVDGDKKPMGDLRYLVSPKDLAGYAEVKRLKEVGVASLKIEGRLKSPEYVAATVQAYREAVENTEKQNVSPIRKESLAKLENTFSRGFTSGYLGENNHQRVVEGRSSSKRGPLVGEILGTSNNGVRVRTSSPLMKGDGVLLESKGEDQGGRIYEIEPGKGKGESVLYFRNGQLEFSRVHAGGMLWKTSDPRIEKELRTSFEGENIRFQRPIDLVVKGKKGEALYIQASDRFGNVVEVWDTAPVEKAQRHALNEETLKDQLGRLGGTPFSVGSLRYESDAPLMVPFSRLNQMRRDFVDKLLEEKRSMNTGRREEKNHFQSIFHRRKEGSPSLISERKLSVLCRTLEQVEVATGFPLDTIYTDFEDQRLHEAARELIRSQVFAPATIRILKPREDAMLRKITRAKPDAILVRNLAAWKVLCSEGLDARYIADYSLNVANSFGASLLLEAGFQRITPSYDLNFDQLKSLLKTDCRDAFEVTVHQRVPMFHMEHCVFCRFLSTGTNSSNCGRPCEKHDVRLKDRMGYEHPLKADYGCRNTLFNAVAQSASQYLPGMFELGVKNFRVDLLTETAEETEQLLKMYLDGLQEKIDPSQIWKDLKASSKLGVTRGSLDQEESGRHEGLYQLPRSSAPAL